MKNIGNEVYFGKTLTNRQVKHICPDCFGAMTLSDGAYRCYNKDCKPRTGLKYDWSEGKRHSARHINYKQDKE